MAPHLHSCLYILRHEPKHSADSFWISEVSIFCYFFIELEVTAVIRNWDESYLSAGRRGGSQLFAGGLHSCESRLPPSQTHSRKKYRFNCIAAAQIPDIKLKTHRVCPLDWTQFGFSKNFSEEIRIIHDQALFPAL